MSSYFLIFDQIMVLLRKYIFRKMSRDVMDRCGGIAAAPLGAAAQRRASKYLHANYIFVYYNFFRRLFNGACSSMVPFSLPVSVDGRSSLVGGRFLFSFFFFFLLQVPIPVRHLFLHQAYIQNDYIQKHPHSCYHLKL